MLIKKIKKEKVYLKLVGFFFLRAIKEEMIGLFQKAHVLFII